MIQTLALTTDAGLCDFIQLTGNPRFQAPASGSRTIRFKEVIVTRTKRNTLIEGIRRVLAGG